MNGRVQGGVVALGLAAGLAVLWWRGYLSEWITAAGAAVRNPPALRPITWGAAGRAIGGNW